MVRHDKITAYELRKQVRKGDIRLGGNARLKIYGQLRCASGRRMKRENRVFFKNETEAQKYGYRPCGHCMTGAYRQWKKETLVFE